MYFFLKPFSFINPRPRKPNKDEKIIKAVQFFLRVVKPAFYLVSLATFLAVGYSQRVIEE